MILGKAYTRIRKSINAAEISISFQRKKDGQSMPKPHRKYNMLMELAVCGEHVNRGALRKEKNKYWARIEKMENEK